MKNVRAVFSIVFCTAVMFAAVLLTGCKTTEPENRSAQPWGYKSGYDYGFPSMINEGR